jgi:acetoacetyl-CoA synthetase
VAKESRSVSSVDVTRYQNFLNQTLGKQFGSYNELYRWSIENVAEFWSSIWDFSSIVHATPYKSVLRSSGQMLGAKWFEGATLNFAENLLRHRDDRLAIIQWAEDKPPLRLTHNELYRQVAACSRGLTALGVARGDRVAGYLPNIPQAVIAMLATTSLGAVWSSCSPDFGLRGVMDRFGQIEPKVLFTADGYQYGGKKYDSIERVNEIAQRIPAIEKAVVIPMLNDTYKPDPSKDISWHDLTCEAPDEIEFAQLPFDWPVYILYSSGTTGVPKCIVHGAGGTLLQHFKEHVLHTDIKSGDVVSYYTTCGWMMWNWLVSALQVGGTIFLYEGNPSYPDLSVLWRAIAEEKIAVFGTSPKFLSSCRTGGLRPGAQFDLSSLRSILSTGSPLSETDFEWVYSDVKKDLQLSSISGGTDIVSCFMLGNPNLPVYAGEIQCRGLGMKVETVDGGGNVVENEVGDLVCTAPFPSMPIYFYNDPDHKKYKAAYFEHFPGIWRHGDYIRITETGGVIVYGRSDATLNPGGVRIGTAEIYAPVDGMDEIEDSLVVAQRWNDDQRIILFVVLAEGVSWNERLEQRIKQTIREQATPRHVPAKVIPIREVPRTLNGKKVELAVTRIIHGEQAFNRDALANPQALDQFVDLPQLKPL